MSETRCALCEATLEAPRSELNELPLPDGRKAPLCEACIRAFAEWYGARTARLFPTRALKRRYPKR